MEPPLLEMARVSKSYDGVRAISGVDFSVRRGEVHALLGENGAGKSTLMKVLAGAVTADAGELFWDGRPVSITSRRDAIDLGIGVIFQRPEVIDHLTVADNVTLGREHARGGFLDRSEARARTAAILERLGADLDPDRLAGGLRSGERQLVEIARALATDVRLLVMDEPTASLGQAEVDRLFRVVRELRDLGIAVVYISHRLEEIFALTDRITVLRDGVVVGTVATAETTRPELVSLMVGRSTLVTTPAPRNATATTVLRAANLRTASGLDDVSIDLHEGEILGVYGLLGSGRSELARALFGADRLLSGSIEVDGAPVHLRSPVDAVALGIGLVPEDRSSEGTMLRRSVLENLVVAQARRLAPRGWVRPAVERARVRDIVRDLRIKVPAIDAPVASLSGGNQQKVVIGKWLLGDPRVLLLDDPTAGVDVGAKEEIYRIISGLTERGTAVLLLSSELPEVLALADRVVVLRHGRVVGALEGDRMEEGAVLRLALGEEAA